MIRQFRYCFFVLMVSLGLLSACNDTSQSQKEPKLVAKAITLPYEFALEPSVLRSREEVKVIEDFVLKGSQIFQAYSLRGTLAPILDQLADTNHLEVIFVCSDGYEANMKLADAMRYEGYIAESGWPASQNAKFAPFYLVWADSNAHQNKKLPWPYALSSIRLSSLTEEFKDAIPADKSLLTGFELFKQRCIKCHSINKVGGKIGPEFNYPKNITEYWQKEDIWHFIQSPQSYRYSSQMPAQIGLSRDDFEEIYAYLLSMKGYHPPS